MTYRVRSLAQNAGEAAGVEMSHYEGPAGGVSYQKGYRTAQEGAGHFGGQGTGFTTHGLFGNRVIGLSGVNRSGLVNWDAGASTPGFMKN